MLDLFPDCLSSSNDYGMNCLRSHAISFYYQDLMARMSYMGPPSKSAHGSFSNSLLIFLFRKILDFSSDFYLFFELFLSLWAEYLVDDMTLGLWSVFGLKISVGNSINRIIWTFNSQIPLFLANTKLRIIKKWSRFCISQLELIRILQSFTLFTIKYVLEFKTSLRSV